MVKYKNLSGKSGVSAYEIGDDLIIVQFKNVSKSGFTKYTYSSFRPGKEHVDHMKDLAINGLGLNSYISKYVKKLYAAKT